jgi:hypothetical protein
MKTLGEAVVELTRIGFRFRLEGETVKVRFAGKIRPETRRVKDLLDILKSQRAEVREFLRYYCPKCGGVVFVGDQCFLCDWLPRARREAAQVLDPKGETPVCGRCAHFNHSRLNPTQGFGRCGLARLSKRPGAYPGKTACPHFEALEGENTLRLAQ